MLPVSVALLSRWVENLRQRLGEVLFIERDRLPSGPLGKKGVLRLAGDDDLDLAPIEVIVPVALHNVVQIHEESLLVGVEQLGHEAGGCCLNLVRHG